MNEHLVDKKILQKLLNEHYEFIDEFLHAYYHSKGITDTELVKKMNKGFYANITEYAKTLNVENPHDKPV